MPAARWRVVAVVGAAVALIAAIPVAMGQTVPDLPQETDAAVDAVRGLIDQPIGQVAGAPEQVASQLLAAAPILPCESAGMNPCAPLFATYARGTFEPPVAVDINPDPHIVEVNLVAIPAIWEFEPGVPTVVWTFNGTIPGPTIEANVGDEVIVHFINLVDTPASIHWHGVEVPATMDGSHLSGPSIPRGGSFDYVFHVNRASLFWYHPHHAAAEQVERGLYGALIVHDPDRDKSLALPTNEHILVLDDALLAGDWQFASFAPADPVERAAYEANGREGNVLFVNGRAGRTLPVEPGVPVRLRVVNTANSTFMRVNVPGTNLIQIGTDGGLLEAPQYHPPIGQIPDPTHGNILVSDNDQSHGVMMTPGERADLVVVPTGKQGDIVPFEWHDWGRGRHFYIRNPQTGKIILYHVHGTYPSLPPQKLFDFLLVGDGKPATYTPPAQLRTIARLDTTNAKVLPLALGHGDPDAQTGDIRFWMQQTPGGVGVPFDDVTPSDPAKPPAPTDANQATVGETAIWDVMNTSHGDHNFHTHGFEFQPLSIDYVSCDSALNHTETFDFLEEKDSIRLPGPPMPPCQKDSTGKLVCPICPTGTAYTRLRAAVKFDDTGRENDIEGYGKIPRAGHSGGWMVHCHILEHADRGMMSFIELRKP